jgi:HK97 family phage major capsid protein
VAYDDVISRIDAQALIPEDVQREIVQGVPEQSIIMRLARRLPDMPRNERRMPVLASLITANFVTGGDTGLKATADQSWSNKFLDAEELAVIVPIPERVLDDLDYDVWAEIKPRIIEAFGKKFDEAVLFGTGAPASWPNDLLTGATAAGNTVSLADFIDVFGAVMAEGGALNLVEEDGFDVNGHVAALRMKAKLRGLRDANGNAIFMTGLAGGPAGGGGDNNLQGMTRYELDGSPLYFPKNGAFDPTAALQFSGDWDQLVWSLRQDITFKFLDQAALFNSNGDLVFSLPQQDMVALRAVMRLAWQLPNPINRVQPTEADRYPFGVLTP